MQAWDGWKVEPKDGICCSRGHGKSGSALRWEFQVTVAFCIGDGCGLMTILFDC